ncbi:pheromone A receptor-domain-containing protein [Phakopsora pachyrhizi]|nr:pheromone A receptor-domain-containing protein [Phakopsora pachyrhizi]
MDNVNLLATVAYSTGCLIVAVLAAVPSAWFMYHGQSAPASLGIWVSISNLVHGINSTVWRVDVVNRAPVWCDIASKIILIYSTGSACSCLCIAKFLAYALSPNAVNLSYDVRKWVNIRNYIFSFGFPIGMIPFHYLYSPNRFILVRTIGCEASYVVTWTSVFFFIIWAPIFGTITAVYTVYVAYKLYEQKSKGIFKKLKNSKVPTVRLAWLCIVYTAIALPMLIYYAIVLLQNGGYSALILSEIRSQASKIEYSSIQSSPGVVDSLSIIGGAIYVAFFTFSQDLRKAYCKTFATIVKYISKLWKRSKVYKKRSTIENVPNMQTVALTISDTQFDDSLELMERQQVKSKALKFSNDKNRAFSFRSFSKKIHNHLGLSLITSELTASSPSSRLQTSLEPLKPNNQSP